MYHNNYFGFTHTLGIANDALTISANVLSFTDKEDNRTRHYLFKEASELESVLALIQNKDPDEQQDSGKAGDGNA